MQKKHGIPEFSSKSHPMPAQPNQKPSILPLIKPTHGISYMLLSNNCTGKIVNGKMQAYIQRSFLFKQKKNLEYPFEVSSSTNYIILPGNIHHKSARRQNLPWKQSSYYSFSPITRKNFPQSAGTGDKCVSRLRFHRESRHL